jgi:hypothetical protein
MEAARFSDTALSIWLHGIIYQKSPSFKNLSWDLVLWNMTPFNLMDTEDKPSTFLRNIGNDLRDYTASHFISLRICFRSCATFECWALGFRRVVTFVIFVAHLPFSPVSYCHVEQVSVSATKKGLRACHEWRCETHRCFPCILTHWEATGCVATQEFHNVYGIRRFITVFTRTFYRSLSWTRWIKSIPPHSL